MGKPKRHRITEDDIKLIIHLRNNELMSLAQIAERIGVVTSAVENVYKRHVPKHMRPPKSDIRCTPAEEHDDSPILCGECKHWEPGEISVRAEGWAGRCALDGRSCLRTNLCDMGIGRTNKDAMRKRVVSINIYEVGDVK